MKVYEFLRLLFGCLLGIGTYSMTPHLSTQPIFTENIGSALDDNVRAAFIPEKSMVRMEFVKNRLGSQ